MGRTKQSWLHSGARGRAPSEPDRQRWQEDPWNGDRDEKLADTACGDLRIGGVAKAATEELPMTGNKTSKGTPIVHMWDCPRPDSAKPGGGYPILEGATHTKVYHATPETGGYSHHARLTVHDGVFYAMWSNQPHGEDSPGQFVRFSVSRDGTTWSDPRRLFPPYGEIKGFHQVGPHGTAAGWVVWEGRVYGVMTLTDCVGFANSDRSSMRDQQDADHRFMVREHIGVVARRVDATDAGSSLGPIVRLPGGKVLMASEPLAKELTPANEMLRATAEALHHAVAARSPAGERTAVDTLRLCEPIYYRAKDGKHVCLLRDDEYSHRMYVSVSDDGKTWPAAQPTDIPDSPSQSDAVMLGDGTVLLIGNQMAPRFDNPGEIKHYGRDPLMVSVSADGYVFTRAFALRTGRQKFRVPNVGGRDGGGQYPSGLVYNGWLHVLYSMGKEDIWISSVALRDLGIGGN